MHEWKMTEAVVEEVMSQAKRSGMRRIDKIVLSVGGEGHLTADTVEFCFRALAEETPLKETSLEIRAREDSGGIIVEAIEGER